MFINIAQRKLKDPSCFSLLLFDLSASLLLLRFLSRQADKSNSQFRVLPGAKMVAPRGMYGGYRDNVACRCRCLAACTYQQLCSIVSYFRRTTTGGVACVHIGRIGILVLRIWYRVACPRQKPPPLYAYVFPNEKETTTLNGGIRGNYQRKKINGSCLVEEVLFDDCNLSWLLSKYIIGTNSCANFRIGFLLISFYDDCYLDVIFLILLVIMYPHVQVFFLLKTITLIFSNTQKIYI